MKALFDQVSKNCSKMVTNAYSTSFSLGIRFLDRRFHSPIYGIYGFVRFADEIVDSFHSYDKKELLKKFKSDTYEALETRISINPILNSFQQVVHDYNIDHELIETFMKSMEMDLDPQEYDESGYKQYINGSAEVVGLMCLKIFTQSNDALYHELAPPARSLGSAFQKVNFLRDLKTDYEALGRTYFPDIDIKQFDTYCKSKIEGDIARDFERGYEGIKQLPKGARFGVYIAYVYYRSLLKKICNTSAEKILHERIRIPNPRKYTLFVSSYLKHSLNLI
ncbi:MAG: phytoene/squalene synthase family protein [Cyclobacteriaceae bacterium]